MRAVYANGKGSKELFEAYDATSVMLLLLLLLVIAGCPLLQGLMHDMHEICHKVPLHTPVLRPTPHTSKRAWELCFSASCSR